MKCRMGGPPRLPNGAAGIPAWHSRRRVTLAASQPVMAAGPETEDAPDGGDRWRRWSEALDQMMGYETANRWLSAYRLGAAGRRSSTTGDQLLAGLVRGMLSLDDGRRLGILSVTRPEASVDVPPALHGEQPGDGLVTRVALQPCHGARLQQCVASSHRSAVSRRVQSTSAAGRGACGGDRLGRHMPLVHPISRAWRQQHSQWAANSDA